MHSNLFGYPRGNLLRIIAIQTNNLKSCFCGSEKETRILYIQEPFWSLRVLFRDNTRPPQPPEWCKERFLPFDKTYSAFLLEYILYTFYPQEVSRRFMYSNLPTITVHECCCIFFCNWSQSYNESILIISAGLNGHKERKWIFEVMFF